MGMYTELTISCELREDIPTEVVEILEALINCQEIPHKELAPLFLQEPYPRNPLKGSSYYFPSCFAFLTLRDENLILNSKANIKNYCNELEEFVQWLRPYVEAGSGPKNLWAQIQYENALLPTNYLLG